MKEIKFADINLEQAVREEINKPEGNIYKSDVEKLKELIAYNENIKDLTGLENLKNLEWLNLSYNKIRDISALKNLKNLKYLDLSYNDEISDVSIIEKLRYRGVYVDF